MSLWGYDNYLHSFFGCRVGETFERRVLWQPLCPRRATVCVFLGKSASCVCVSLRVVVVGMCVFIEDKAWLMREGDRHF